MKKYIKYFAITWFIVFVLFNTITLTIGNHTFGLSKIGQSFWLSFAISNFCLIGQLVTVLAVFHKDSKRAFYSLPLLKNSYATVVVSFIVSTIFLLLNKLPNWIGSSICLIILGYNIIKVVKALSLSDISLKKEQEIKNKTAFKQILLDRAEYLLRITNENEQTQFLRKICESIKYSDPVSCPETERIEQELTSDLEIYNGQFNKTDFEKFMAKLNERNLICKRYKSK